MRANILRTTLGALLVAGCTVNAPPARADSQSNSNKSLRGIDLGGYGELHFSQPDGGPSGSMDLHRFVLFVGSDLGAKTRLFSEIEIEHSEKIEMEQAYLEYSLATKWDIRAGLLLVPVGWINLHHEPPTFHGVERPVFNRVILPTTWREGGISLVHRPSEDIRLEAGVFSGLDASSFTADLGIRGGRGGAAESQADDLAWALRMDVSPLLGLDLGLSAYWGEADGQRNDIQGAAVALGAAHMTFERLGFRLRGEAGMVHFREALRMALITGENLAQDIMGYYIDVSYDFFQKTETEQKLSPFLRFERIDLQNKMPAGLDPDPALTEQALGTGLSYFLSSQSVFKADYRWARTKVPGAKVVGTLSLGAGWSF